MKYKLSEIIIQINPEQLFRIRGSDLSCLDRDILIVNNRFCHVLLASAYAPNRVRPAFPILREISLYTKVFSIFRLLHDKLCVISAASKIINGIFLVIETCCQIVLVEVA